MLDDNDLEERLRDVLSRSAPPGLPTIGVRERIVDAVRVRRARRHRVAGALAATCLVVAGATVGIAVLHPASGRGSTGVQAAPLAPRSNPSIGAAALPAPRANCGEVAVGGNVVAGCAGLFGRSSGSAATAANGELPLAVSGPGAYKASSTGAAQANGAYDVVVPVGRPVTLVLPGSPGHTWTDPAVASGQGADASRVRTVSAQLSGAGKGSSATLESPVAVTVVVDASELQVCGQQRAPCGLPTVEWSVVLEFRAS
ncbi:MAG: hypothetical protein ACLP6E_12725 [Acidimicrobiales bacterium]